MIRLIREDGIEILLNTETIQQVGLGEERGAIITLKNGEILKVKNPVYDIVQKTKAYTKGLRDERREYDKKMGIDTTSKDKPEKERHEKERPDRDRRDRDRRDRDRRDRDRRDRDKRAYRRKSRNNYS